MTIIKLFYVLCNVYDRAEYFDYFITSLKGLCCYDNKFIFLLLSLFCLFNRFYLNPLFVLFSFFLFFIFFFLFFSFFFFNFLFFFFFFLLVLTASRVISLMENVRIYACTDICHLTQVTTRLEYCSARWL